MSELYWADYLTCDDLYGLRSMRVFLTSRQKMHPVGVEMYDDMMRRIEAGFADASRAASPTPASPAALPVEAQPVASNEWKAIDGNVYSDNFDYDAALELRVSGDFANESQKQHYAELIAKKLNGATCSNPPCRCPAPASQSVEAQPVAITDAIKHLSDFLTHLDPDDDEEGYNRIEDTISALREMISPAPPAKGDGADSDTPNNTSAKEEGTK